MADKAQLKCKQGDIYPLCSLDNMVRSVSSSEAVSIPVLDAAGKITTSYFPDGIGSGAETETDITSLGSASVVVVEPGSSYVWDITGNQTISAVGSSGYIGSSSFIRINMKAGAITGAGVTIETPLAANTNNYCNVEFRGGEVYLSSFYGWRDAINGLIVSNSTYILTANIVNSALVLSRGSMLISSGGIANYTSVNTYGSFFIYSGGMANSTAINSRGSMYVYFGGVANSTSVTNIAAMYVYSGGMASRTTLAATNANMYVYSGGMASNTTVISYGGLFLSGGTANSITVNRVGKVHVRNGGTANSTTVNADGSMYVYFGGTANSITVNSWGYLYVSSGGTALNVVSMTGAKISKYAGGTITYA